METELNNSGIYLYCIIPGRDDSKLELTGMQNEKLYTVEYRDITAVVSNSAYKAYDICSENLIIHENSIREIMKVSDVLPFNFGNVMKSESDLIKFLDNTYKHIQKTLAKIAGRIELGLKVIIKKEFFNEEIENTKIKKMKKQLENADGKIPNLLKVEIGKLVQESLEKKEIEFQEKVFNYLKQYSIDAKINNCSIIGMVLNAAFLVDKDKQQLFDVKLNDAAAIYEEKYNFKYTGPWPPYNFVDIPEG